MTTHAADALVTDSAAAATSLASGVKTRNGAIGVDAKGRPVATLLELAQQRGFATGLVATCSLTHATPAAFAAHRPSRTMDLEIALDIAAAAPDVLIGGGRRYFQARADGRDLVAELRAKGYPLVENARAIGWSQGERLLGLVADLHLPRAHEGRGDFLSRAADDALRILARRERFFLMIEGSQIDWGSHSNDGAWAAAEMADFDDAIGRVLDWAERDGGTLVVVTSDHETGGMAILGGSLGDGSLKAGFATEGHTATLVPVLAFGPGAEAFSGVYDNTDVFEKIRAALGL
jgi:alkaline phosphatase